MKTGNESTRCPYIAVHSAVALMIYIASMASIMLLCVTMIGHLPRVTVVAGLGVFATLGAGFGAVQLWRMPPEARPLFRTRRVALALGTGCSSIFIVVVAAVVAPATALIGTLAAGLGSYHRHARNPGGHRGNGGGGCALTTLPI